MYYEVSEMAEKVGISPSALRYYDREGLLPFVERTKTGRRRFQDSDYEWLQIIECLKRTGMKIKDIREYIHMVMEGDGTIEQRLAMFTQQREQVRKQMEELQKTLDTIEFKCWYYTQAKQDGTTRNVENMTMEELQEKFREAGHSGKEGV